MEITMKHTVRDAIIEAKLTEEMINTFVAQIAICSIAGGLYLHSWVAFGFMLLFPLSVFILSKKYKWCRIIAIILCVIYAILWCIAGGLIGSIFSTSACIVLAIIFLIPGAAYNLCAINYFCE